MIKPHQRAILLLAAVLLAGCSDSDVKEVNSWMDEVKATTRPSVTPLAEPKTFRYLDPEEAMAQRKALAEKAKKAKGAAK